MSIPEGFILPSLGRDASNGVFSAVPTPLAVAGAIGTQIAEVKLHREYNAKKTAELAAAGQLGEVFDDYEVVVFTNDRYSKVPLRASALDPSIPCYCELSVPQQKQVASIREAFRKNEGSGQTAIGLWDALNASEKHYLVSLGILFVEQLAAYEDHMLYQLGNGGRELRDRALRHVASKKPSVQEEFDRQMQALTEAKEAERRRAEEKEKELLEKLSEMSARLMSLEKKRKSDEASI